MQKKVITEFVNCIFRINEANMRKKASSVVYTVILKIAENELKMVGIGGNYYGLFMQEELDIANRRPKGPLKTTRFEICTFFA